MPPAPRGLNLIRTDSMANWYRQAGTAHEVCRHDHSRFPEKCLRRRRLREQGLDIASQCVIARTGVPEKQRPVACVTRERRVIQLLDAPPSLGCHGHDGAVSRLYAPSEVVGN